MIALPSLSLALGALAWLRYGTDMPWFDDWRGYDRGYITSFEPRHLFAPMNDTLSPIGLALDAVAQRYLDGNSVAYQFLSMVIVLGALLVLQWKLLRHALQDKLHAAACFSLTVLMLQPGSYWGLENLAYYQALPLVFILGALWLLTRPAEVPKWRDPAVAALGLLAGFTYISGAFAGFAAGLALLGVTTICYRGDARRRLTRGAIWLTAASAVATATQFYISVLEIRDTHAGIPLAWPTQPEFWAFYGGKLARSLLLPERWPEVSLAITVLACVSAAVAAWLLLRRAATLEEVEQERRVAAVYVPVAALVFVYLMLVTAGRTNFRAPEVRGLLEIFSLGFTRFHFFWATLLWPWVAAAVITLCRRTSWSGRPVFASAGIVMVLAAAVLMYKGGGYDHMARQRELGAVRVAVAHCLLNELQRGGEVRCPGLLPPRSADAAPDAYPAYLHAKKIGASFVRYFPLLPSARRREDIESFYRLDSSTAKPRTLQMEALGRGSFRAIGSDPQFFIQTHQPQVTRRCAVLDVEVDVKVAERDRAQLFFVPAGDAEDYSERNSTSVDVGVDEGKLQTVVIRIESDTGFFESMRFDPVTRPQSFELREVRLYCVRELL